MKLDAWTTDVVAMLNALDGVAATADPRDLSLPGVLVYPLEITPDRLDAATYTVTWDLVALAQDAGTTNALGDLSDLATAVEAGNYALSGWSVESVQLTSLNPAPLPALRATLTTECED